MNQQSTVNMSRTDWLKARQSGIGGSDIAALMGVSPYKTAYDIYLDKTREIEADEMSEAAYWGTRLEALVADEYALRNNVKVQRVNFLIRSEEYPFACANIDRAVVNPAISGTVRVSKDGSLSTDKLLEIKTSSAYLNKNWGDEGSDLVPDHYLLQCQWYMGITKVPTCDLAVLIGGNKYQQYTINFDEDLFAEMIAVAGEFWENLQNGISPDPVSYENIRHKYRRAEIGSILDITENEQAVELVSSYLDLKDREKAVNDELNDLKKDIAVLFADKETMVLDKQIVMTYKNQTSKRLDSSKLRKEHPELIGSYEKVSETRVLRVAA
ncbi:YqaJ viral recombinase family protein [Moraxella sp. ZJ142]|uniref:YqaJ viral recombinase family nuclease n=1 Tax=Moraxella marmotae TaxID=3344520 RepID=UPI0035D5056E